MRLTPQGRAFYDAMLRAASDYAGAPISGEDMLEALRRLRVSSGQDDPQFADPLVLEGFKRHLQDIVKERQRHS